MLRIARDMLLLACLAIVGMMILLVFVEDGPAAVAAIAGTPESAASSATLRMALMLDTLLPIGYGAGFVFFAIGLAKDQHSTLLALAAVLFTLAGVTMDFIENGLTVAGASNSDAPFIFATVGKYGLLGLAGVLISSLLTPGLPSSRIAVPAFRYFSPVALALLLSGYAGSLTVWFFAPGLLATFLFAAWVAHCEEQNG